MRAMKAGQQLQERAEKQVMRLLEMTEDMSPGDENSGTILPIK